MSRVDRMALTVLFLLALTGCEPMTTAPEAPAMGPLVGNWALTMQVSRDSLPGTCDGTATFTVSEQTADGRLSWALDQMVSCSIPGIWLAGSRSYQDHWGNTPWAVASGMTIRIQTPDPVFIPSCLYTGVVEDQAVTRMSGQVVCREPGLLGSPPPLPFRGTWSAKRQAP